MDARALLKNMGWSEGQGLGKSNQGIAAPIKPKVQTVRHGLGLDPAASLVEPWWAKVFNETAKKVSIEHREETSSVPCEATAKRKLHKKSQDDALEVPDESGRSKKKSKKRSRVKEADLEDCGKPTESLQSLMTKRTYGSCFVKGTTLGSNEEGQVDTREEIVSKEKFSNPIDDFMLKQCGGRTGHKGARYGVLKGKMARVSEQERKLLKTIKT